MARGTRKRIMHTVDEYLPEEHNTTLVSEERDPPTQLHLNIEEEHLDNETDTEFIAQASQLDRSSGGDLFDTDDDIEVGVEDEASEVRRRGPTKLKNVWGIPNGQRIVVNCNDIDQPIGEEAGVLAKFLGMVARNGCLCSLSFRDWRLLIGKRERNMEQKNKLTILNQVKKRFLYPARMEKWILRTIGERWRQHKSNLKSIYFDERRSIEANIKNSPKGVLPDQWIALVNIWMTPKAQKTSEANRINCAQRKSKHTAGTKSFARNREDLREQDPEKKYPHRAVLYMHTHKTNNNKNTNEHVVALKELIEKQPDLADTTQGKVAWKGDALSKILGEEKPGHVHGLGLVPNPDQVLEGTTSKRLKHLNLSSLDPSSAEDVVALRLQVEKLVNRVQTQDATIQNLQHTMEQQKRQNIILDDPLSPPKHVQSTTKRKRIYGESRSQDSSVPDDLNYATMNQNEYEDYDDLQTSYQYSKTQNKMKQPNRQGRTVHASRVSTSQKRIYGESHPQESSGPDDLNYTTRNQNEYEEYEDLQSSYQYSKTQNKEIAQEEMIQQAKRLSSKQMMKQPNPQGHTLPASRVSTSQKTTIERPAHNSLKVGSYVMLKSCINRNKKVAIATIISCDPKQKVGRTPLGKECFMVRVGLVIAPDEPLVRPYNTFTVIGDIGSHPIAWPSSCIEKTPY